MANPNPSPETRWKPGQSGNAGGRPKKMTVRLREFLEAKDDMGKPRLDRLIEMGYNQACAGEFPFWQAIFDRMDGKVTAPEENGERKLSDFVKEAEERYRNFIRDKRPDDQ